VPYYSSTYFQKIPPPFCISPKIERQSEAFFSQTTLSNRKKTVGWGINTGLLQKNVNYLRLPFHFGKFVI
jgi:hypothetical protein